MATATKTSKKAKKAGKTSTRKSPAKNKAAAQKAVSKPPASRKATSKKPPAKAKASKPKITEPERSSPAMAEVDADVLEFIQAIDDFKKANGRPFPSWSEVLLIVKQLGYKR